MRHLTLVVSHYPYCDMYGWFKTPMFYYANIMYEIVGILHSWREAIRKLLWEWRLWSPHKPTIHTHVYRQQGISSPTSHICLYNTARLCYYLSNISKQLGPAFCAMMILIKETSPTGRKKKKKILSWFLASKYFTYTSTSSKDWLLNQGRNHRDARLWGVNMSKAALQDLRSAA